MELVDGGFGVLQEPEHDGRHVTRGGELDYCVSSSPIGFRAKCHQFLLVHTQPSTFGQFPPTFSSLTNRTTSNMVSIYLLDPVVCNEVILAEISYGQDRSAISADVDTMFPLRRRS